ncbi:hypothetical protein ACFL6X_09495, partial [Candidatus Latescibacterota bacterium]
EGEVLRQDPLFVDDTYWLDGDSPAIDSGVTHIPWRGSRRELVSPAEYCGKAPDLGALELQLY